MKIPKINLPDFSKLTKSLNNIKMPELDTDEWIKQEAERKSQPFHTNYLLEDLIKSQTPKWVNYAILILTAIILGLTIYSILK